MSEMLQYENSLAIELVRVKLTFLSAILKLCSYCVSTVPQLCPNCFSLNCAPDVPQVTLCLSCAPTEPESFQFCAPTASNCAQLRLPSCHLNHAIEC